MIEIIKTDTPPRVFNSIRYKNFHLVTINAGTNKLAEDEYETNVFTFSTQSDLSFSDIFKNVDFELFTPSEILELIAIKCKNAEDALPTLKQEIIKSIDKYDSSSAVNSFEYAGNRVWLDKDTRVGLVNSTNMLKSIGRETATLWLNDISVTLQCDVILQMLCAIEIYALECYNVTASHKAQVMQLTTIQDILEYDIKNGYPDNLNF